MVDHASAREKRAFGVDRDAPGVAGSFAPDLKHACCGVDTEDRAREGIRLAVLRDDLAGVEHTVPAIQPTVGPPREGIGQFVSIGTAESGGNDLFAVGLAVAV